MRCCNFVLLYCGAARHAYMALRQKRSKTVVFVPADVSAGIFGNGSKQVRTEDKFRSAVSLIIGPSQVHIALSLPGSRACPKPRFAFDARGFATSLLASSVRPSVRHHSFRPGAGQVRCHRSTGG